MLLWRKTLFVGGKKMLMDRFQNKLEFSGYDIPKQEVRLQYWKRDNVLFTVKIFFQNLYCK